MNLPKPLYNHVLLRATSDNSRISFKDGTIIWIDQSYEPNKHRCLTFEVMELPPFLVFGKGKKETMLWETDIEIRKGDEVIVTFLAVATALNPKEPKFHIVDGETYIFVPYAECILAKRKWWDRDIKYFWEVNNSKTISHEEAASNGIVIDGTNIYNVIMLNGWCLVQAKHIQYDESKIIMPEYIKKQTNKKEAKLMYVGKPNKRYIHDVYEDSPDLKSGMTVVMENNCDIPLETSEHASFFGKNIYWRVMNRNISAILQEESII